MPVLRFTVLEDVATSVLEGYLPSGSVTSISVPSPGRAVDIDVVAGDVTACTDYMESLGYTLSETDPTPSLAVAGAAEVPVSLPTNHQDGIVLSRTSATVVAVGTGSCRSDDDTHDILVTAPRSADIETTGAGGRNAESVEVANAWYAVFIIDDTTEVEEEALFLVLEADLGSFALPAGYDKKKRVRAGYVRNDGGDLVGFAVRGSWMYWRVRKELQGTGSASGFTPTAISAATRVAPSAIRQQVFLRSQKVGNSSPSSRTEVVPDDWNEAAGGQFWECFSGFNANADPHGSVIHEMPVGPLRLIHYRVQPAGNAEANVNVSGWKDSN